MANAEESGMDAAVERLELKIAYLERANVELSDELYRQRQLLDALVSRQADLLRRLDENTVAPASAELLSEKPPHY
jgi:uncharacterized coiled-coil protein SlyX